MKKVTPFLWFNDQAEDAVAFYATLFPDTTIGSIRRYPPGSPGNMGGKAMSVNFTLDGQEYIAFNGGPHYQLSPAFSFFISVETQAEVDALWNKICDGGKPNRCGWCVDPFGVSWQVIPTALGRLMGDPDPAKAGRVMQAMLKMDKLDIATLQKAYDGE